MTAEITTLPTVKQETLAEHLIKARQEVFRLEDGAVNGSLRCAETASENLATAAEGISLGEPLRDRLRKLSRLIGEELSSIHAMRNRTVIR